MSTDRETPELERNQDASGVLDDIVLVSNRQPYRYDYDEDAPDGVEVETPAGGLAIALDPVMQEAEGTWVAWGDGDADFDVATDDGQVSVPPSDPEYTLQLLSLSESEVRGYYRGYANRALWPLCHSATGKMEFDADEWECYKDVNEQFADQICQHVTDDTTVWFQDYHFGLAPRSVRDRNPDATLIHFFHIPWPAPDVFRVCPQAEALLDGLLGNDVLTFHTSRYSQQFLRCVDQLLPTAVVDWRSGTVAYEGHRTQVATAPLGVEADDILSTAAQADTDFWEEFRTTHDIDADATVALGVDRLDYTKGIPERLDALERLFEKHPELRGDLTYVQKGCGTREGIEAYREHQEKIQRRIEEVNDRFGTDDWTPVVYTTEMYDREDLFALYRHSDIAVVTPVRDGMNLVAKEFIASQVDDDGVLLLSPLAGSVEQLGDPAVEFDPYDTEAAADAFVDAVEMDAGERQRRMHTLRQRVHDEDVSWWLDEMERLAEDAVDTRSKPHGSAR
jgi:trehalose 6-phosphate synthase